VIPKFEDEFVAHGHIPHNHVCTFFTTNNLYISKEICNLSQLAHNGNINGIKILQNLTIHTKSKEIDVNGGLN
jgi:hypothetical protein